MRPCFSLPFLFLTVLQATAIPKLDARADPCDPLLDLDCSGRPTTLFGTADLNLPPSGPDLVSLNTDSGITFPAAPNLALPSNTDADPEPLTTLQTQLVQAFATPMDVQVQPDTDKVPSADEKEQNFLAQNVLWDQESGGWKGFCYLNGVGCKLCSSTPDGGMSTPRACRDAVLRRKPTGRYEVCFKEVALADTCTDHNPADDKNPRPPSPKSEIGIGSWGYCGAQTQLCTICWLNETGESTGCAPAVRKQLQVTHSDGSVVYLDSLCYKGAKVTRKSCINPEQWDKEQ
ncbi:hypothetical protein MMC22_004959 [Lobaria immixta]|nr:hypothetical protein [Lobaria immixta]